MRVRFEKRPFLKVERAASVHLSTGIPSALFERLGSSRGSLNSRVRESEVEGADTKFDLV